MLSNLFFCLLTLSSSFNYYKVGNGGCRTNNTNIPSIDFFSVGSQELCEHKCSLNNNCTGIEWITDSNDINCQLQGSSDIQNSSNLSDSVICLKKTDIDTTYKRRFSTTEMNKLTLQPLTTTPISSTTTINKTRFSTTEMNKLTLQPLTTTPISSTTLRTTTSRFNTQNTPLSLYPYTTSDITTLTQINKITATTNIEEINDLDGSGLDGSGLDVSGLDDSGLDGSGLDVSGLDVSGLDVSGLDGSGLDDSGLDGSYDNIEISENVLRKTLFESYSKTERPVKNFTDNVKLKYGIEIKSLEYFDQKGENIKFNLWLTQMWKDDYLKWNKNDYNYNYLNIYSDNIWVPDLELYNAASTPKIYDTNGGLKLFNDGTILWIRPTTYSFSCKLDLIMFPFDEQRCTMTFGSWKYSANFLDLRPFDNHPKFKNISVDPKFSHNEWNIIDSYVVHEDIEYLCCPDELWPNSFYTIVLKRNYTKYLVVIAMTLLITIASLVILTFSMKKYTRTFVLVFLPLSIIWLQVYISSKIPVIEYYTLMEKILVTCFIITILNAMESGFIYIIINEKFECLTNFYNKIINTKIKNYKINNVKIIHNSKNNNVDIYKNLNTHLLWLDNCYRVLIISCFIIIISIFMTYE